MYSSLSILWHWLSLELEWKLTFSSPVATAEFFQICWHSECSTFTASSFRIWNSSAGIPSSPLALFVVMIPKAYLTSHSRMPCSRSVITPSWLSELWRFFFFLYSSVYSCHLLLISSASVRYIPFLSFIMPIFVWNDPSDYRIHGILQTRILEWVAFPFSRGSSQCRDRTQVSSIAGRFFTRWSTREAH